MSETEQTIERLRAIRERNKEHYKKMGEIDQPEENVQQLYEQSGPFNSGKIRNPERIDVICDALKAYWREYADLRLGQLIWKMNDGQDLFYVEDTEVMYELGVSFDELYWVMPGDEGECDD